MFIIGVYGPSGAGKSTLAKNLAQELDATYVEVDKYWKDIYYSEWFQKVFVPLFKRDKNLQQPIGAVNDGKVRVKDLKASPRQAYIMRRLLYVYLNYRINRKLKKTNADVIIFDHIKFFKFEAFEKSDFNIYVNTPNEVCENNIMKRDYITKERMKTLVENHVVEHSNEYDDVKKDFVINAFCDSYERDYKELCLKITQAIQNKEYKEFKEKHINLCKQNNKATENQIINENNEIEL